MKPRGILNMQIGKNGLTQSFIEALKNALNTHTNIKISVLKSATRSRQDTENFASQICMQLGEKFTYRIIGYTIFIKKWRKMPASNRKIK